MIDKILTTQSVGSTSSESSKRTEPARRGGDSFESVLARKVNEKDKSTSPEETDIEAGDEMTSQDTHGEQSASETTANSPNEKRQADATEAGVNAEAEDYSGAGENVPGAPAGDRALSDTEAAAAAGAGVAQTPSEQSARGSKEQFVRTGSAVANGPATEGTAQVDADANSMDAARMGLLSEKYDRNGTSALLETHLERGRQELVSGSVAVEKGAQPSVQAQVQTSLEAMKALTPTEAKTAEARFRDVPLTGVQPQAVASMATARPQTNTGDTRLLHPAASGSAQALASAQFQKSDAVLKSSSAVVTSLLGASDAARVGEDVLTQRGADSFVLPQLLAEASVRSGASSFRAETPRYVAQQLAEAVATGGKRNVDVTLNPRELGHVNMRVMTTDMGVMITINAERPETEDLMRRHIQDLAREFKEMGFTDISFQFGSDAEAGQSGEGEDSYGASESDLHGEGDAIEDTQSGLPLSQHLNISADGLDMRI